MSITMQELKGNNQVSPEIQANLDKLLIAINKIRDAWGKPMTVTSGFRTMEDHLRIYKQKGITDPKKIPMQSKHLYGKAVDIADPGLVMTAWLKANPDILKDNGFWCEDGNSNWVHFQIESPASGKLWFLP
jgi:uncharacterized protein YcbK (DUF882 family)